MPNFNHRIFKDTNAMKKSIIFITILLAIFGGYKYSYSQSWQWAVSCGKGPLDEFGTVTSDKSGNIYLLGHFGGTGIFGSDTLISIWNGGDNLPVAICKLGQTGEFQWIKTIKSQPFSTSADVTLYNATNSNLDGVYSFGEVKGDTYFDTVHFVSQNNQIFIGKYNNNGTISWLKELNGNGNEDVVRGCVDDQGNLYFVGGVTDTAHFDDIIVPPGIFIAKCSASGHCIWVKSIENFSPALQGLAVKGNNLILEAWATSTNPITICGTTLTPVNYEDLVLVAFDTSGNCRWAKMDGKASFFYLTNPGFDEKNNLYICGTGGDMVFGQDTLKINNSTSMMQLVLVKYDTLGNVVWAKNSNGDLYVVLKQINVGEDNTIYATGYLSTMSYTNIPETDFGGCTATIEPGTFGVHMFVARFDDNGNCVGAKHAPTDYLVPDPSGGLSVTSDSSGNCIVSGQFQGTTFFDSIPLTSQGLRDIFVAKCGQLHGTGFEELKKDEQLIIYSNPTEGKCNIIVPDALRNENKLTLIIFDSSGKIIQNVPVRMTDGKISLNIEAEAAGMYNVILSNGKKTYTGKIIFE